jgi:hypothetical protein
VLLVTCFVLWLWTTTNQRRVPLIHVTNLTLVSRFDSMSLIMVPPLCCFGTVEYGCHASSCYAASAIGLTISTKLG